MVIVTGMHRSGTSCIAGLLVHCGFSLGTSHPLLNVAAAENPKGHFENRGVLAINDIILGKAGGSWSILPPGDAVQKAGVEMSASIQKFGETFNGNLVKDPRLCLTISLWRDFCPGIKAVVMCVRNPIGVAGSLKRRNSIPVDIGLRLWYEYNMRFIQGSSNVPAYIVDYDNLDRNLEFELSHLLADLGVSMDPADMMKKVEGFYSTQLNHDMSEKKHMELLPPDIRRLYEILLSQSYAERFGNTENQKKSGPSD